MDASRYALCDLQLLTLACLSAPDTGFIQHVTIARGHVRTWTVTDSPVRSYGAGAPV